MPKRSLSSGPLTTLPGAHAHPLIHISLAGWCVLPSESSPSVPLHSVEREGLTPNFFVGRGLLPPPTILLPKGPPSPPGRGTEGEDSGAGRPGGQRLYRGRP